MIDTELVTAAQLAAFLKAPSLAEDPVAGPLLQEHLDAAVEVVVAHVGPIAADATVAQVRASGAHLVLPAIRIGAVVEVASPTGSVVDLDDVRVDAASGVLTVPRAQRGVWTVTYEPTAGGAAALRLAVKIIAAHLWGTQRGASARPAGVRSGGDDMVTTGYGYAVPRRAAELIAAHQVPTIA